MAKKEKVDSVTEIISLRNLAERSGIPYHKIYHNFRGTFNSLTHQDKLLLVNAIYDGLDPLMNSLGYYLSVHKIKDQALPDQPLPKN